MKKPSLLLSIGLAVAMIMLVLLISGEEQQTSAVHHKPSWRTQEITHTVSLPIVTSKHDPAYVSPFGIIMYGRVDDTEGLREMEQAGAGWVTTMLHWSAIEPSRGTYNWSSFDTKAQNAQAAGMHVFVLFTGNPTWAAALPGGPVTDTQDLVNFVTLMAERYDCDGLDDAPGQPCVHYWSFYAEPDNGDFARAQQGKGYWGHNGAGYAAMLSEVAPAIHNANPRARVLIGGLAYDWFEEDGGPFVQSFLSDTLAALNTMGGAQTYLDAVAFHFYPINQDSWLTIREKARDIQGIVIHHGAGELPLVCPEMGYWSSPNFRSSEPAQAYRLVQMFVRGLSADVQLLFWYKVFDAVTAGSPEDLYPDKTSGLLRVDGSFKPSYQAYQTMTRELAKMYYRGPFESIRAEGYIFSPVGGKEKTVLWSREDTVRIVFPYSRLRLVTTFGEEFEIQDNQIGSPGDVDGGVVGQIELEIHENQPVYVEQQ